MVYDEPSELIDLQGLSSKTAKEKYLTGRKTLLDSRKSSTGFFGSHIRYGKDDFEPKDMGYRWWGRPVNLYHK